jgi:uncharacterized membrane protein
LRSTKSEMPTETQSEDRIHGRSWWLAAAALALVGFGVLGALSIYRHDTFRSNALDLGYLDQVVWNTLQGNLFANSIKGENWPSYLAGHFAPAIAVAAPLFWVWDDVRMLLLVQAAVLALAGLPLFALFRDHGQRLGLAALAAFYLNPWLHRANLHDFHTVLLAAPLISMAIYGVIRQRYTLTGAVLTALLLVKEDMGLVVALFGLYLLLFERQRAWRWGVLLLILGLAWVALAVLVLIPSFATSGEYRILSLRYAFLGSSPTDAIQTVLRDPLILARQVLRRDKILALVGLLASMAFLPLLGGALLVIALPLVWYLQLSDNAGLALLWQWHIAVYLSIFFGAIYVGFKKIPERWRAVAAGVLLFVSTTALILDGSVIQLLRDPGMAPERRQVVRQLMAEIPPEASVSVQDELLPHLSHRQEIFLFPTIEHADYILMDRLGSTYPLQEEDYQVFWEAAQDPFGYEKIYDGHDFLLLRRQTP